VDCGNVSQTVVGSDENQAFERAHARDMNGDAAAKASADDNNMGMIGVHAVKQSQRVGDEGAFRGFAAATAVAAVVHCVEGAVRKCIRQRRETVGDVLGVAPKVDDGLGARPGEGGDEYSFTVNIERKGIVVRC